MRETIFAFIKKQLYTDLKSYRENARNPIQERKIQAKLNSLLKHAIANSPYYRDRIQDCGSGLELTSLPFLRKEDVAKYRGSITSSNPVDRAYAIKNSTSGSTGQAMYFYSDARDGRAARAYRGDEFVPGYHFLDRQLIFWGAERDLVSSFSIKKLVHHFLYQKKIVSTYHMDERDISLYLDLINLYKPKVIAGYPSALYFIGNYIRNNNIKLKHKPIGVITSGEMLYPHQRVVIESSFSSYVYDRYGCREFGHVANECSAHNGYHYDADDLIIEIVDEDGLPCKSNVEGRILITDLNNYVFPMIRYEIGDRGILQEEDSVCICGSTLPKLKSISGRSFDVVHGVNGNKVSGSFWTLKFRNTISGLESFQIRQTKDFTIILTLKVNSSYSYSSEIMIREVIRAKLGDNKVIIDIVDEMEYSPTGKFKWIHSEVND